jgi:O-acetylhomoserine/O-acetylserine sulfhydrylase-like pyridoxal-dependent enzyme
MMQKCINTMILSRFLDSHPDIQVNCNFVEGDPNGALRERLLKFGMPGPLFTIDMEKAGVTREAFVSFFDCLSPVFHHEVSLGQSNTLILCPALTSHSEMDDQALKDAGISRTTVRIAVGVECPKELIAHFIHAAQVALDPVVEGFSSRFMPEEEIDRLVNDTYMESHRRYIGSVPPIKEIL